LIFVAASNQTINFGSITFATKETKPFTVKNGLEQCFLVDTLFDMEAVF
jgi:hypothetical protein